MNWWQMILVYLFFGALITIVHAVGGGKEMMKQHQIGWKEFLAGCIISPPLVLILYYEDWRKKNET